MKVWEPGIASECEASQSETREKTLVHRLQKFYHGTSVNKSH